MKTYKFIVLILLFIDVDLANAEAGSIEEKTTAVYKVIFEELEAGYLYRDSVDWVKAKALVSDKTSQMDDFEKSLSVTTQLFDYIECNHCQLFSENNYYQSTLNKQLAVDDFSVEFVLELEKKPEFHVKVINDEIGYINIPGMLLIDLSVEELSVETQKMYDQIAAVAKNKAIKGWIIDLRFNIGGNSYPMLASLHYLLGDNLMYNAADINMKIVNRQTLKGGAFYSGQKLMTRANTTVEPNTTIPTAVIIGKMTASAGENVAVAFKNRKNSVLIGEQSYGFLTGNKLVQLPHNNKIALTSSYITDANNTYREFLTPDIKVSKMDNFEDMNSDGNIVEAIKFIHSVSHAASE